MEKKRTLANRLLCYFMGLFMITVGTAFSVQSDLGVAPVSAIPYALTLCFGIEMGKATILFHCVLVCLQILILRKNFKPKSLLQVPVGIIFGYFTTFCNYLVTFIPAPDNMAVRIIMILISTVFVAAGIFFYLPAGIMPLAGEGIMQAISETTKRDFPKVKVLSDIAMVIISLATCLLVLHHPGSVGIGTIIAAVLCGIVLDQITRLWAKLASRA